MKMQGTINRIYFPIMCFTFLEVTFAATATPCNHRQPLLDRDIVDSEVLFYLHDDRITSSSSAPSHSPSEVTMSGNGWCAQPQSTCTVGSEGHYLQVDFGAEIVVEAISIGSVYNDSLCVTEYYVEYGSDVNQLYCVISEESNGVTFDGVDVCRDNPDEEVKNFTHPVITRFIRIVPLEWEGVVPCLRLELYGCYVKECRVINLLTPENTNFSTHYHASTMDVWCAYVRLRDSSPNANMTFAEPLYFLYAIVRGDDDHYVTEFSLTYRNSSGDSVTYMNVDGYSIIGLASSDDHTILLWTPINTSWIELRVHDYVSSRSCIGIDFYGCTSSEVINHAPNKSVMAETTTETVTPTSCVVTSVQQQTSVITVTTTVQVSATAVIAPQLPCTSNEADESSPAITSSYAVTQIQQQSTLTTVTTTVLVSATTRDIVQPASTVTSYVTLSTATPQSSCSCSDQQQTSASSSSSDSDAVTICVPIVVVFGLVILVVVVIIGIFIWRKTESSHDALPYNKVDPDTTTVENDLYGHGNNETSGNDVQGDRKDSVEYEYPMTVIRPNQPVAPYENVAVHKEAESEASSQTNSVARPYLEPVNQHKDPQLEHNPTYLMTSKTTDQS